MKKILGIILVVFCVSGVFAQKNYKFAHINSVELLSIMPGRDTAKVQFDNYRNMLQKEMETMQLEYQNKVQVYLEKQETYSDLVKKTKETEIQEMQQRIQGFQQTAQQDLRQKEAEIFQPIMDAAQKAIEKVAKANSFTYVFDVSAGGVIYFSETSTDLLPLVKKELGIE
ncbi:MAG: OmpH family outer membrane protein [Bacteroidales bacterium]|nr:OmpH family outer membrane protein [Bacteroidales bacterium]